MTKINYNQFSEITIHKACFSYIKTVNSANFTRHKCLSRKTPKNNLISIYNLCIHSCYCPFSRVFIFRIFNFQANSPVFKFAVFIIASVVFLSKMHFKCINISMEYSRWIRWTFCHHYKSSIWSENAFSNCWRSLSRYPICICYTFKHSMERICVSFSEFKMCLLFQYFFFHLT